MADGIDRSDVTEPLEMVLLDDFNGKPAMLLNAVGQKEDTLTITFTPEDMTCIQDWVVHYHKSRRYL